MDRKKKRTTEQLIRIDSGYFVAGVVLDDAQIVTSAAPIISYMMGWSKSKVISYCFRKEWNFLTLKSPQK